ncbi:MAG: Mut7-C RNAse domain-containing protein [Halanaeroarchaeum sp.]
MTSPNDATLLLDAMCGGIRTILRMAGYDAAYTLERNVETDEAIEALARAEDRVLITRDEELARSTPDAILLRAKETDAQLEELAVEGFELSLSDPVRCSRCNSPVEELDGGESTPPSAPDPADQRCWRCRECGQVYWKGSHWKDVADRLERL